MRHKSLNNFLFSGNLPLHVFEVELELHSIFWFHTLAQPREKYVHVSLPLIHNYPLMLALLGRPVEESYVAIAYKITKSIDAKEVWEKYSFYVYPATASKMCVKTMLLSMGGTGYLTVKAKTRASVPDLTSQQVFLPGSVFKTYIITKSGRHKLPEFVRLGAKRYGVFKASYRYLGASEAQDNVSNHVTHLFNVGECPAYNYYSVMSHYAGEIALSGTPKKIIAVRDTVLAAPSFLP